MPSFRRALANRPLKVEKHEGTWSNLGENASTTKVITVILAKETPSTAKDIEIGSVIKSVYFETNLNGVDNSGTVQVFHWMVYKSPASAFGTLDPSVYDQTSKRYVLKRGMEMLPEIPLGSGGTVQTKRIFVVKIPKKYQRFGDNDALLLVYKSTSSSGINYCGITVFKEWG